KEITKERSYYVSNVELEGHQSKTLTDVEEELFTAIREHPAKVRALALVSDLIFGTEPSWQDPATYSFAHGGKDGYPYPVDRGT
ncbi:MAG: DUF763 domain-containing protein, partial [Candidatus Methanospirareceae archaeon]